MNQASPREVLGDFVRVLEERQTQLGDLLIFVRELQTSFEQLRTNAEKVLHYVQQPGPIAVQEQRRFAAELFLAAGSEPVRPQATTPSIGRRCCSIIWRSGKAAPRSEDCPLPELFRQINSWKPGMTLGRFHDALRQFTRRIASICTRGRGRCTRFRSRRSRCSSGMKWRITRVIGSN